jgi:hypothetical protein
MHRRQRQVVLGEPLPHRAHRLRRPVAPARLVVPERPAGLWRGTAGECRVGVEDLGQRADRHVQSQRAGLEVRHQLVAGRVDRGVAGVVDEAVGGAVVVQDRVHRGGDVQGVAAGEPGTARVGVPAAVRGPAQVPRGPPAEPVQGRCVGELGPQRPADPVPGRSLVTAADPAVGVGVRHRPIAGHMDGDPRTAREPAPVDPLELRRGVSRGHIAGHHGVRRLLQRPLPAH